MHFDQLAQQRPAFSHSPICVAWASIPHPHARGVNRRCLCGDEHDLIPTIGHFFTQWWTATLPNWRWSVGRESRRYVADGAPVIPGTFSRHHEQSLLPQRARPTREAFSLTNAPGSPRSKSPASRFGTTRAGNSNARGGSDNVVYDDACVLLLTEQPVAAERIAQALSGSKLHPRATGAARRHVDVLPASGTAVQRCRHRRLRPPLSHRADAGPHAPQPAARPALSACSRRGRKVNSETSDRLGVRAHLQREAAGLARFGPTATPRARASASRSCAACRSSPDRVYARGSALTNADVHAPLRALRSPIRGGGGSTRARSST